MSMAACICNTMPPACNGVEVSANLNVRDAISSILPAARVSDWRTPGIDARAFPPAASAIANRAKSRSSSLRLDRSKFTVTKVWRS